MNNKFQELRKSIGLSQEELAEKLGVTRQSVSKWELGYSFPETEKLIELSRLFHVSVDSLLKEAGPEVALPETEETEALEPAPKKPRRWGWKLCIILVLLGVLAALIFSFAGGEENPETTTGSGDLIVHVPQKTEAPEVTTEAPVPEAEMMDLAELQTYYFDYARKYRFDYVPYFAAGEAPVDSPEYLFYAFAVNLDNWGEEKGKMSRAYVDDVARTYFAVGSLNHMMMWKGWDFDGETYTAYPGGIKELPFYDLRELRVYGENGSTCYELILDRCHLESGYLPGEEDVERFRNGDRSGFAVAETERFVLTRSNHGFDRPVFLAHETVE